jgi:hypothetical protein
MRRMFGITTVAAFLMVVAAWASPASAEPWNGYYHGYHGEHWHHGGLNVYIRPWYPVYRPPVVVSRVYPSYRLPVVVREVRLHDDERSPNSLTTTGNLSTSSGQPRAKLYPMSSRANPESRLATIDSSENTSAGLFTPAHPALDNGGKASGAPTPPALQNSAATMQSGLDEPFRALLFWLSLWAGI